MFVRLREAPGVLGTARRKRCERIKVRAPNHERATNTFSGKLPRGDELSDAVLRDPENFGCLARANQIARLGHARNVLGGSDASRARSRPRRPWLTLRARFAHPGSLVCI